MAHKYNTISWIAIILLIVGGLNWGLVGAWNYNLVASILGAWPSVLNVVYILVGLSAIYEIYYVTMKTK